MENVGNAKDCLVSGGPRGLKREYAFASSQAALATPVGRTRARNSSNPSAGNDESMDLENKRAKNSDEEITTNGSFDKHSIPETPTTDCEKLLMENAAPEGEIDPNAELVSHAEKYSTSYEVEVKALPASELLVLNGEDVSLQNRMVHSLVERNGHPEVPNLSELKKPSLKLRQLMKSSLLEGLPVRYIRGPKIRGPTDVNLRGIICGMGILCSCDSCGGKEVVSPNKFEVHAGSGNKRPAEYIYLENGKNLRDLINVCKETPLEGLVLAIQNLIRCGSQKEPISKDPVCTSPTILEDPANVPSGILKESENDYSPATVRESSQPNSPSILVNSESSGGIVTGSEKETDLQVTQPPPLSVEKPSERKPQRKLTKKDIRMHRSVFNKIEEGTPVEYMVHKEVVLSGYKRGMGIKCSCCDVLMSPSQFEAHAGWGSRRKPYLHTFVMGTSLHEMAVQESRTVKIPDEKKDTICYICEGEDEDGDIEGGMRSCNSCPRVFHTECLPLSTDPENDYHCRYCWINFKTEKNTTRVRDRVPKADRYGGCTLCGCHDFTKFKFGPRTVIVCDQCERDYHISCLKKHNRDDLKELPEGEWLCCTDCKLIYQDLQDQLASEEVDLTESSMSHIKRKMEVNGSATGAELDIKWRLFRGKILSKENRSVLSQAVSIFHDRFDPIVEPHPNRSGTIDLIPRMVYGNLGGQDLGGMYCGILFVNSIVASAGVFRIFGREVAELPLVATSIDFEGLGYFQALFSCIEDLLTALKVKDLVLPAAKEAISIWTDKFGFVEMSDDEIKRYMKRYPMMAFRGTTVLHKPIMKENVV